MHRRSISIMAQSVAGAIASACVGGVLAAEPVPCAGAVMDEYIVPQRLGVKPHAAVVWDPDGSGPRLPQIVIQDQGFLAVSSGDGWRVIAPADPSSGLHVVDRDGWGTGTPQVYFTDASKWRTWDGVQVLDGWDATPLVTNMMGFDPDGPGGQPGLMVGSLFDASLGGFYRPANPWMPLGNARSSQPIRFVQYDRDGSGPEAAKLLAFGTFLDGFAGHYALIWNGSAWSVPGDGLNGIVNDAVVWDRDGAGPIVPYLVAGGKFTASGANGAVKRLAKWDGASWTPVSAGSAAEVTALGVAPLPDSGLDGLVVAGTFSTIGGVAASRIATFDGTTWRPIGDGLPVAPTRLAAVSAHGPLRDSLRIVCDGGWWNGDEWWSEPDPVPHFNTGQWYPVVTGWDADGAGPIRRRLAVLDVSTGDVDVTRILVWDEERWTVLPFELPGADIWCLAAFDPDGDGPEGEWLVLGGLMGGRGPDGEPDGSPIHSVMAWTGAELRPLGSYFVNVGDPTPGFNITSLGVWDQDGAGGELPSLFVSGDFDMDASGRALNNIARWDGQVWQPLGSGLNGVALHMLPWDPDASGPRGTELLVGGDSVVPHNPLMPHLALWDGSSWNAFPGPGAYFDWVQDLSIWNRDGPGPEPRMPVAGYWTNYDGWYEDGIFYSVETQYLYRWTGLAWEVIDTSVSTYRDWYVSPWINQVRTVQNWDPDGQGPKPPVLALGGTFQEYLNNPRTIGMPAVPFNTDVETLNYHGYDRADIRELASYDPDGTGPANPILIGFGQFSTIKVRRNTGETDAYTGHDVIRLMDGAPQFRDQPAALPPNPDTRTVAIASRAMGPGRVAYQWFRDGVALVPGTTAWGSIVHSVDQPSLVISNASSLDDGAYVCRVSNACGSTDSEPITLTVDFGAACLADYNGDNMADILDFLDFIADFSECESMPAPCGSLGEPDVNGDGTIDILDLLEFIQAFSDGC